MSVAASTETDHFIAVHEPRDGWLPLSPDEPEHFTLVFVCSHRAAQEPGAPRVLLGKKKRGFGRGIINGLGGKPEGDETMDECAIREVEEECGLKLDATHLEKRGELSIVRLASPAPIAVVIHVYSALGWTGEVRRDGFDVVRRVIDPLVQHVARSLDLPAIAIGSTGISGFQRKGGLS